VRPERVAYLGVGGIFTPELGILLFKFFPAYFVTLKAATDFVYTIPLLFVAILSNYTSYDRIKNIRRLLDQR
jgi:uncharacterized membrane protein